MFTKDRNIDKIKELAINDLKAIGRDTITVDSSISDLNAILATLISDKGKPIAASFSVDSNNTADKVLRYTIDGTDPVATTTGIAKKDSDEFLIFEYSNLQRFKVTEESSNTTTIEVTFFR